jgi:hypothetical protein
MNTDLRQFLIKTLIVTFFAALLTFLIYNKLEDKWTSDAWPFLLLFFAAGNIGLFVLYQRAKAKKLSSFTNFFMIVYLLYNRDETVPFLLTFFVYYILFTALEVSAVTKKSS